MHFTTLHTPLRKEIREFPQDGESIGPGGDISAISLSITQMTLQVIPRLANLREVRQHFVYHVPKQETQRENTDCQETSQIITAAVIGPRNYLQVAIIQNFVSAFAICNRHHNTCGLIKARYA